MTQTALFPQSLPRELTGKPLAVASLLLDHRGKGLLTSDAIAAKVGLKHSADVRHIVQELVDNYHLWIVGSRDDKQGGYRLVDSYEDFVSAQMPGLKQCVTTLIRIAGRIGWKRLSREIFRMGGGRLLGVLSGKAA